MTCSLYTTWCNFFFKMEPRRLHLLSIWRKKDRKHVTVYTSIGLWIFQVLLWRMSKAMWNMCFWHASNMRGSLVEGIYSIILYINLILLLTIRIPKHHESGLSFWNENSGSMVHKSGPSLVVGHPAFEDLPPFRPARWTKPPRFSVHHRPGNASPFFEPKVRGKVSKTLDPWPWSFGAWNQKKGRNSETPQKKHVSYAMLGQKLALFGQTLNLTPWFPPRRPWEILEDVNSRCGSIHTKRFWSSELWFNLIDAYQSYSIKHSKNRVGV